MAVLASMQKLLAPSLEFHAAQDAADNNDVRFLWEVSMVRGRGDFFGKVSGSSTMPGLLDPHRLHQAAELVSLEMIEKVARPVAGRFQVLSNESALADIDTPAGPVPRDRHVGLPFDDDYAIDVAAAAISYEES